MTAPHKLPIVAEVVVSKRYVIPPPDPTEYYPPNPRWPPDPACFVAQEPIDCTELDKGMGR